MKKIVSIILAMLFAFSAFAEVPVMEILDESCEHDWQKATYKEFQEYEDGSSSGFVFVYQHCSKCGSNKKYDNTWFIFHDPDELFKDYDVEPSRDIWTITTWTTLGESSCEHDYVLESVTEDEDHEWETYKYRCTKCNRPKYHWRQIGGDFGIDWAVFTVPEKTIMPRYAINNNEAVAGQFTASEFCHIEDYSAQFVDTNTVFTSAKYYGVDEYGNETIELIAEIDDSLSDIAVAFAHIENITVIEGELPEMADINMEYPEEETEENSNLYKKTGAVVRPMNYSWCPHDSSNWTWITDHKGTNCRDANIQYAYCPLCHSDRYYSGWYYVHILVRDNPFWNHEEIPVKKDGEAGWGPHLKTVTNDIGDVCTTCGSYLHVHKYNVDDKCISCDHWKGQEDDPVPFGYN